MKKNLLTLTILTGICSQLDAQTFPYSNSLQTSASYNLINGSTGVSVNANVNGTQTKGVLLTPAEKDKFSGIELNGINFNTNRGFNIDFEYFQWGGSNQADGIALVLYDGTTTNPSMGAKGAGLGYTYSKGSTTSSSTSGFTNGYLAFGFDSFGNFHRVRREGNEWRNGVYNVSGSNVYDGINPQSGSSSFPELTYQGDSSNRNKASYFTIRGSSNNPKWIQNSTNSDNSRGYPLLYTVNTQVASDGTTNGVTNGASLSANDNGGHGTRKISSFNPFNIRSGVYTEDIKNAGYRKAYLQFRKGKREYYNSDRVTINEVIESYFVDVLIETNTGRNTIVKNEQFRISAKNVASRAIRNYYDPNSSNSTQASGFSTLSFSGKAPNTLKMAITGSTGLYYQNQLVRNVNIALPYSPNAMNDAYSNICNNFPTIIGHPLTNDTAYNNDEYIERYEGTPTTSATDLKEMTHTVSTPSIDYIDTSSFSFMTMNSTGEYEKVTPNQYLYTIPGVGTFQYIYQENGINLSPQNAYIVFTPISSGAALNNTFNMHYTIKNKPNMSVNGQALGDEEYRSAISTITVTTGSSNCSKPYIITNKNVTNSL
ncbi:L-type lectin family protein [Empedobacter tilapiae]|uniref:Uncharacterized protein n=1 Tax=Empedobacter tilapiae TaxID=2491114 RepID=A0A4Z1B119_9FLAO|nr:hypothetical protein [Empedobacter tilapiae]TGN26853.1 hypothetical protein E4J94_10485 [Empedobacter tilapiae]